MGARCGFDAVSERVFTQRRHSVDMVWPLDKRGGTHPGALAGPEADRDPGPPRRRSRLLRCGPGARGRQGRSPVLLAEMGHPPHAPTLHGKGWVKAPALIEPPPSSPPLCPSSQTSFYLNFPHPTAPSLDIAN